MGLSEALLSRRCRRAARVLPPVVSPSSTSEPDAGTSPRPPLPDQQDDNKGQRPHIQLQQSRLSVSGLLT